MSETNDSFVFLYWHCQASMSNYPCNLKVFFLFLNPKIAYITLELHIPLMSSGIHKRSHLSLIVLFG